MTLDKLKPAWKLYKLESSANRINSKWMLTILEEHEATVYSPMRVWINIGMCLLLVICCQGG